MYKNASKLKLRFNTSKGLLSVEQMWDLSMTAMARIVRALKKELKADNDDDLSFLDDTSTPVDAILQLKFNIAKDIYLTKKDELEAVKNEAEVKVHNQKILKLIKDKQEAALGDLSVEELEKMMK